MTFILDTSAYSDFNRGDPRLRQWFTVDNIIMVPLIVVGELRAGFIMGSKEAENEKLLQRFLDSPNVRTVTLDDQTTMCFSRLYKQLREAGTPIGTNDMWIASLALQHHLPILTTDSDFSHVADLSAIEL